MLRGQAFDTFKLMISAVIAVAILAILMAVLGVIRFGPTPESIMQSSLSDCVNSPQSTKTSIQSARFEGGAGDVISFSQSLINSNIPQIILSCDTSLFSTVSCTSGLTSSPSITFNSKSSFDAKFRVKCDATGGPEVTLVSATS